MSLHVWLNNKRGEKKRYLQGTASKCEDRGFRSLQISAHMCVIVFRRLNAVKTPSGCVYNASGEWEGCAGVVGLMVCRPLTSRITGSISQSWFQWGGRGGGLGRAERSAGFRAATKNEEIKKSDENEMCLVFEWRQLWGCCWRRGDLVLKWGFTMLPDLGLIPSNSRLNLI